MGTLYHHPSHGRPGYVRGGGRGHRRMWSIFVCVVVAFYVSVLYLFFYKPPVKPASSALRAAQQRPLGHEEGEQPSPPAQDVALAAVQNPPGSIDGVVVLGMHRSGTSMITGLLERMGLHLGSPDTLLGPQEGENDKGFFERLQVVNQNDELMRRQDVNWALNVFNFDHVAALKDALGGQVPFDDGLGALGFYNDPAHAPWAVKDPRLCITLKFWTALWRTPPAVLFVYRHPIEVAKSLVRRKEFGLPRGLHLWMAYNRLAIENSRGLCRVVTSDAKLVADGPGEVRRIHDELRACGVAIPRMATLEEVSSFIDPNLRHHRQTRGPAECDAVSPALWRSDAENVHERARQETAYGHARRVYCAMEDGSAFRPDFAWEDLPDVAPP